jgi:hypothetical protein
VDAAHVAVYLSLLIAFSQLARSTIFRFPAPISGNFYPKTYFPVMGGPSPLSEFIETSSYQ